MSSAVRVLLAAILAVLLVAPASAVQPRGSAAWTTDGFTTFSGNLREGPGMEYQVTGTVEVDVRVRVERCSQRWCLVRTDSGKGWMSLDNLSFGQEPDGWFAGPKYDTQRGNGVVCFFTGEGFSGDGFCAKSGRVIHDLALLGRDNEISSVEISGAASAVVCRDRGFRSLCEVVDVSKGRLDGLLNNGISSIRVY
ncbi:MAG TPA: SH3 domain-containing protein [Devosia sp.]|nr:SH3 domain-containing protein [Devosia sp.]